MADQIDRERYLKDFPMGCVRKEALKQALDIRKFEIELYWKRATYFWAFIAASFAGYFALQKDSDLANIYIVTCLGFLFSLAWYLVNRGSSAWQKNWESHVDLLEDDIMGPLYKTVINHETYRFYRIAGPFPFSPSRINNLLALGVTIAWVILMTRTLFKANALQPPYSPTIIIMSIFTIAGIAALFCQGPEGPSGKADELITIEPRVRKYK